MAIGVESEHLAELVNRGDKGVLGYPPALGFCQPCSSSSKALSLVDPGGQPAVIVLCECPAR